MTSPTAPSQVSVLFWMDDGGDGMPGGNVTQMRQTAAALSRIGCKVATSTARWPVLRGVDVVHGFNLDHVRIRDVRRAGIPVVLSTIYWPFSFRSGSAGPPPSLRGWLGRISLGTRSAVAALTGRSQQFAHEISGQTRALLQAYEAADLLLPNSHLEAQAIKDELGVSTLTHVVPNAADPRIFDDVSGDGPRAGVIMAARIEPFKNQLRLIKACQRLGVSLTLVGAVHPHHQDYALACRRAAGPAVTFVDFVTHDRLARLLRRAQVHALPSWFETTGLSSLEAALAGCDIVTTSRGFAAEYFGDFAHYCEPNSIDSIEQALRRALSRRVPPQLSEMIRERFTWERAAEESWHGYQQVLK